jgi:putative hydrolase
VSDNLFDRLFELFQTSDPVNWGLAEEVTKSIAGQQEPIEPQLAEEYEELALAGQLRLADAGALDIGARSIVPHPIDRASWARQNYRSFGYLLEPLADAMRTGLTSGSDSAGAAIMGPLGPALVGLQAGTMVGFMSERALGLFDLPLPAIDANGGFLIIPNVEAFARDNNLDAKQVRLWATMRELVNHETIQRGAVRIKLRSSVEDMLSGLDFDASRLMDKLNNMQDPGAIQNMLSESGGMAALLGGEGAVGSSDGLAATAALVEGYGEFIVRRSAGPMLTDLAAIEAAHRRHRSSSGELSEQLHQLFGIDLNPSSAGTAADFFVDVERRWGTEALENMWGEPDQLPTLGELADVVGWAARVLLD